MKVVHINSVYKRGSTGKIVYNIHKNLIENGHESLVIYGRYYTEDQTALKMTSYLGNIKHVLMSRITGKHAFFSKKETKKMVEKIKEFNPDIIHLHNLHGYYLSIEVLFDYLKTYNGKIVWTLHDCWPFTGQCSHFMYKKCNKWKSTCSNCPELAQYPRSLVDKSTWNFKKKKELFTDLNNVTLVTPSNWMSSQLKESFLKDYPVKVIHNGIDLDIYRNKNLKKENIVLGVSDPWTKRKGLGEFINLRSYLNDDIKIVLIGLKKTEIDKLPDGIKGITRTENQEELVNYYNKAKVFFNPTKEDNYPTVNLEAEACGTPVLTYDSGGSSETIHSRNSKAISQHLSLKKVANLLETMMQTQKLETDHREISEKTMIQNYMRLYKEEN